MLRQLQWTCPKVLCRQMYARPSGHKNLKEMDMLRQMLKQILGCALQLVLFLF